MNITIRNKEYELKYTFNSFRYMEEFDVDELQMIERKPFKIIPILRILLHGAVNHNPKQKVSMESVDAFLEEYSETGDIGDLLEELIKLLEESNFFKSLQGKK